MPRGTNALLRMRHAAIGAAHAHALPAATASTSVECAASTSSSFAALSWRSVSASGLHSTAAAAAASASMPAGDGHRVLLLQHGGSRPLHLQQGWALAPHGCTGAVAPHGYQHVRRSYLTQTILSRPGTSPTSSVSSSSNISSGSHQPGAGTARGVSNSADNSTTPATSGTGPVSAWNVSNGLSVGRGLSGPVIAYWVLFDQWALAIPALAISGATDWLDGYLARRLHQTSVLGSYLDPLGDKLLVGSVMGALAYKGMIPGWVVAVVVGRDVALVGGMFVHRFRMFGWRWPGAAQFFSTDGGASSSTAAPAPPTASEQSQPASGAGQQGQQLRGGEAGLGASSPTSVPPPALLASGTGVPYMRPLMISKLNTVLQLSLVGGCMTQAFYGWPGVGVMHPLELTTAATTVLSSAAYLQQYVSGKLLGGGAAGAGTQERV